MSPCTTQFDFIALLWAFVLDLRYVHVELWTCKPMTGVADVSVMAELLKFDA